MAAIETRRLAVNFAKLLVSLGLLFPFHFPARRRACRPIRFQHARRKEAFGPPPTWGMPKAAGADCNTNRVAGVLRGYCLLSRGLGIGAFNTTVRYTELSARPFKEFWR